MADLKKYFRWNLLEEHTGRDWFYSGKTRDLFRPAGMDELSGAVFGKASDDILSEKNTAEIRRQWKEISGLLHAHSVPEKLDNSILYIKCNKSVYVQELMLHRRSITERIFQLTGIRVKDLKITAGSKQ